MPTVASAGDLQEAVAEVVESTPAVAWSICVRDGDGRSIADHQPDSRLPTASVGKVLLLIETARRMTNDPEIRELTLSRDGADPVGEAGLWQYLHVSRLSIEDIATLIASFSDNLATNVLLDHIGLEAVQSLADELGLERTALLDRVRGRRGPNDPPHLSVGSASELSALMHGITIGSVVSPAVAELMRAWLSRNADLSMVAGAFDLDPLAHAQGDQDYFLYHKTGSNHGVCADVGGLLHDKRHYAYAVVAHWSETRPDPHRSALHGMRRIGAGLREYVEQAGHAGG